VSLLGVYLGQDADLFGLTLDNRKGVWERKDVVAFHDELLDHLKGGWQRCLPLDSDWHRSAGVKPFRDKLGLLVRENFSEYLLWGWKDPRTCVLLPLWLDVLRDMGVSVSAVHVVRNPLDVARSLHKRNGFPYDKSLGLWFSYNLTALLAGRTVIRHVLSYDRLIGDWKSELRGCAASLELDWPKDQSRLEQEMGEFVRPELRHSVSGRSELVAEGVPGPVIRLFDILEGAVEQRRVSDVSLFTAAERIYDEFRSYSRFFEYDLAQLWEREREVAQLRWELEELRHRVGSTEEDDRETTELMMTKVISLVNPKGAVRGILSRIRRMLRGGEDLKQHRHDEACGHRYKEWILKNEPAARELVSQRME
jgi:hypothetical protein